MSTPVSSIWRRMPTDALSRTRNHIDEAYETVVNKRPCYVFFRADDVAVPGKQFARLMEIFLKHRAPLNLALVPAWLTLPRWQALNEAGPNAASLWCWHQHGWRHTNHEIEGKKQEFGSLRDSAAIEHDIISAKQRLGKLMGKRFYPVFTPPWNRCNQNTLDVLKDLGYVAISRSRGSRPQSPKGLPDICVDVDLHTRKEKDPRAGWNNLFKEFKQALSSGCCGIMIHHQRMNDAAFDFLDVFLKTLIERKKIQLVHFRDMIEENLFD